MPTKWTTELFCDRARDKHGSKYNYDGVVYKSINKKVKIICPEHGVFFQPPGDHLKGHGCMLCARNRIAESKHKTVSYRDIVKNSRLVHGDAYIYPVQTLKKTGQKIKIICPRHGEFTQDYKNHINGHGCSYCGNNRIKQAISKNQDDFIQQCKDHHGDRYDYSKTQYISSGYLVTITCDIHGDFQQLAGTHIRGAGCHKCNGGYKYNLEEFIERANQVHDNAYDYTNSVYINSKTKVDIRCETHGIFSQLPESHLQGTRCPKCANAFGKMENEWLNSFKNPNIMRQHRIKLSDGSSVIADGYDPETNTVYEFWGDYWHGNPEVFESSEVNRRTDCSFGELYQMTINKIRKYESEGYNIISIWETDYLTETPK